MVRSLCEREPLQIAAVAALGALRQLALGEAQLRRQRRELIGQFAGAPFADAPFGALQRFGEALVGERLQDVVARVDLERVRGVAAERRHEDDDRTSVAEILGEIEPGHLGHLDVEKDDVGVMRGAERARRLRVAALEDVVHFLVIAQQRRHHAERQRLVVGDEDTEARHALALWSTFSMTAAIGSAISTIVWPPLLRRSNVAAPPYSCSSRDRVLRSPVPA